MGCSHGGDVREIGWMNRVAAAARPQPNGRLRAVFGRELEVAMIFTGKVLQLLLAFGVRALRTGGRVLANATAQLVRAIKHRRDAQILARLDPKMLADIGLTQSDVRDAFSEPLWRDPTGVLATRISERRSGRRRT